MQSTSLPPKMNDAERLTEEMSMTNETTDPKAPMKLTVEQLDELETLAKAATQGGWRAGRGDMQSYDGATGEPFKNVYGPHFEPELHHGNRIPLEVAKATGGNCMADAQFIGAAHPEVVLSLIAAARASLESSGDDGDPLGVLGYDNGLEVCEKQDGYVVVTGKEGDEFHPVAFFFDQKRAEQYCELEVDDGCGGTESVAFDACATEASVVAGRIVCANDYTLDDHAKLRARIAESMPAPSAEGAESMAGWTSGRNPPKSESIGDYFLCYLENSVNSVPIVLEYVGSGHFADPDVDATMVPSVWMPLPSPPKVTP